MTSPRTALRLSRLLAMLPWVIAHPGQSVQEVCSRFGYTSRGLVEDLNLVFVCGLPGYGPGDLMDGFIDEDEVVVDMADYFSRPIRLTAAEALMLLAAGMAVLSSGAAPQSLESAVEKLRRVAMPDAETMSVDVGSEPQAASALRDAAARARVARITYTSLGTGETTVRSIEPWAVFTTLGNWYVNGYCRRAHAERVFRVDRVREVEVTDETFEPPAASPEPVVRYSPSVGDVTARIRLSPEASWVSDYYPVHVVSDEPGAVVIELSARDPIVVARLLLRLGSGARLEAGDEVGDATRDLRERVLARYR